MFSRVTAVSLSFFRFSSLVIRKRAFRTTEQAAKRSNFIGIGVCVGTGLGLYVLWRRPSLPVHEVNAADSSITRPTEEATARPELPVITRAEVERHASRETGVWVTYKDVVYDITKFVDSHPGGPNKIMLAAGKAIDPFWSVYQVHLNSDDAKEMLDELKIGRLDEKDCLLTEETDATDAFGSDPWPDRSPLLKINSRKPFNAEPLINMLTDNFHTPNSIFMVRNHLPVPEVDVEKYRLGIEGEGLRSLELTLEELKTKFLQHEISASMQCAGNRRSELSKAKTVRGLGWGQAAISTATWKGVKLRDILLYAGYKHDGVAQHIEFVGLDKDMAGEPYAVSIPVEKAVSEDGDVLLAYEMNGETLPRDHGFPIRVVVPGLAGARNAKWLSKIIARKDESHGFWQQNDYKIFDPSVTMETADFSSVPAIQETPIQSAITEPEDGSSVAADDEMVAIKGYAFSGGGRGINRVDVSVDGGKSWQSADIQDDLQQPYGKRWAWTLWTVDVPIPREHAGHLDICCRAVDSSNNSQPEHIEQIWNFRGLLNNSWHHIQVNVEEQ